MSVKLQAAVGLTEAAMQSETKRQDRSVVQCDPSVLSWRWWMKAGDAHSEGRPVTYAQQAAQNLSVRMSYHAERGYMTGEGGEERHGIHAAGTGWLGVIRCGA